MKNKYIPLLVLPWILFQYTTVAQSAVPNLINYQGYVTDAGGIPIGNGGPVNRRVTFRFWNHPSNSADANRLYSEYQTVTINEGDFSVLIGQGILTGEANLVGDLSDAFSNPDIFLGITVDDGDNIDNEPEISPRQQIATTAFAFRATVAESVSDLAITTNMLASGAITSEKLAANSITSTQLANGSVGNQDIAADSIDASHLKSNSVSNVKIQSGAVTGAKIANETITSTHLAPNSVNSSELAANSVGNSELGTNSVYSNNIAANQVTSSDLGTGTFIINENQPMRIIRGTVNSGTDYGEGSGWYVLNGDGTPTTQIIFFPAFSGIPTVVASVNGAPEASSITVNDITTNSCVFIRRREDTVGSAFNFSFIAIGPR